MPGTADSQPTAGGAPPPDKQAAAADRAPAVFTLTLNAAIDHSIGLPRLTPGKLNRVSWEKATAGGKGVNVAAFLADLGCRVVAGGLLGADNTAPFERLFSDRGIADAFVRVPGRTRVNLKLIDEQSATVTEINFPGLAATAEQFAEHLGDVRRQIDSLLADSEYIVVAGSLPAGIPATCYADLIGHLAARGKRVLLDSSGEALRHGVAARPWAIKPNQVELEELVGRPLSERAALCSAARAIVDQGVRQVIVSLGQQGALFVSAGQCLHALPPAVAVRTTVGAGDALVAGFVAGCLRGLPPKACARLATAAAVGALAEPGARLPAKQCIESLMARVVLSEVAPGD